VGHGTVGAVEHPYTAYCASCSVRLGGDVGEGEAREHARQHARVTGHPVQLVDARDWVTLETIVGEPSLPLWEAAPPE
jgi:hypothetical protein